MGTRKKNSGSIPGGSPAGPVSGERDGSPASRRDFLRRSGAAAAGLALVPEAAISVETAPRKIRMGIVGGGFGSAFQWHEHPDCIVEAVSDLLPDRRDRLMQIYRCSKAYNSLEELVRDRDIDAVGVFTDAPLHDRRPVVDIYEALAFTVPGIVAHESALRGGELLKIPRYDP